MSHGAITFDFHNTLFSCDAWFDLEVHEIMTAFLRWYAGEGGFRGTEADEQRGRAAYRDLRADIQRHGQELDAASCVRSVLATMALDIEDEHVERGVREIMARLPVADPMVGAVETVETLHQAGVPMAIVSSAIYAPFLHRSLRAYGLGGYFAHVTTSAGCGFYKSRPEIFWDATMALGVDPWRTVHVGDSPRFDIAGARRAGLQTVWVSHGRPLDANGESPDLVLNDLDGAAGPLLDMVERAPVGCPV
ncbi:MAG TPA: HAD family hydrolase [Thermomicrobiales bacterium]|nr:HAD family hydrolase [Thermomicrobiales bacterium]